MVKRNRKYGKGRERWIVKRNRKCGKGTGSVGKGEKD